MLSKKLLSKIQSWRSFSEKSKHYKEIEMSHRLSIYEKLLRQIEQGEKSFSINDNTFLTIIPITNYMLDYKDLDALKKILSKEFDNVIKTKYELKIGAYKKLPEKTRKKLDRYISTRSGAPRFEIKEIE
jgi:hypothetical protein